MGVFYAIEFLTKMANRQYPLDQRNIVLDIFLAVISFFN